MPGARVGPLASSLARYRLCIKYTTNRLFYTRGVTLLAVACPGGGLVKMIDPAILFVSTQHLNFPETRAWSSCGPVGLLLGALSFV